MKKLWLFLFLIIVIIGMSANAFATSSNILDNGYDDLWMQEVVLYETAMGNMIDSVCKTDIYLPLALSGSVNDRSVFVYKVIEIYCIKKRKSYFNLCYL